MRYESRRFTRIISPALALGLAVACRDTDPQDGTPPTTAAPVTQEVPTTKMLEISTTQAEATIETTSSTQPNIISRADASPVPANLVVALGECVAWQGQLDHYVIVRNPALDIRTTGDTTQAAWLYVNPDLQNPNVGKIYAGPVVFGRPNQVVSNFTGVSKTAGVPVEQVLPSEPNFGLPDAQPYVIEAVGINSIRLEDDTNVAITHTVTAEEYAPKLMEECGVAPEDLIQYTAS